MHTNNFYVCLLVTVSVLYLLRVLPLTLIRRPIRSRFLRSFLFYVPYVTLAVMTFPAIIVATRVWWAGVAALFVGSFVAWRGHKLINVAAVCCMVVLIVEFFL